MIKLFHFIQALIKVRYLYFVIKMYYFLFTFFKRVQLHIWPRFCNRDVPSGQPQNERGSFCYYFKRLPAPLVYGYVPKNDTKWHL